MADPKTQPKDVLSQMLKSQDSGTAATSQFTPGATPVPTPAATPKTSARGGSRSKSATLLRNAITSKAVSKDTPQGLLRTQFSETARICGYTNASNDKIDFARKKDGTKNEITIFPRNTPPAKPDGVIVMYSRALWDELSKSNADVMNSSAATNAVKDTLQIIPMKRLISWMQMYTAGYLLEDEHLFEPVVRRAGKTVTSIQTIEEVASAKRGNTTPNKPAIYVDLPTTFRQKDGQTQLPRLRIKSNYRSNLLTPHNYISRRRYVTMPVKLSYTKEEIAEYMALYFNRYNERPIKSNSSFVPAAWSRLSAECASYFSPVSSENGKWTLAATSYFTDNQASSAWNTVTVDHWYDKDPQTGVARQIPGREVQLVVHHRPDPDKNASIRKEEIQDPKKAAPGAYTLDLEGAHSRIAKATGGKLTFKVLEDFYAENSSGRGSGTSLSGVSLMGLSEETIARLLQEMANSIA